MHKAGSRLLALVLTICIAAGLGLLAACTQQTDSKRPTATATSVSADIGPNGGTISACGSTIAVPAGSIASPTTLTMSCGTPSTTVPGYELVSPLYRFEPSGLTFARPATVTIAFEGSRCFRRALRWCSRTR
jgi:hypothetical protein